MKTKEEISKKINLLIEKNYDAYEGYKKTSEKAQSLNLRSYLIEQATDRKDFALTLSELLKTYNPAFDPEQHGSITGTLHRTWIDVKTIFSQDNDEAILHECLHGDKASIEEYKEFLENYPTASPELIKQIQYQLEKIINTLDRISRLEDIH